MAEMSSDITMPPQSVPLLVAQEKVNDDGNQSHLIKYKLPETCDTGNQLHSVKYKSPETSSDDPVLPQTIPVQNSPDKQTEVPVLHDRPSEICFPDSYMVLDAQSGSVTAPQCPEFQITNTHFAPKPAKVRTDLALSDKVRLIHTAESTGKSQRTLAAEFHISLGSVNNILRRKREYIEAFERNDMPLSSKSFRRQIKRPTDFFFEDLNRLILKWIEIAQSKSIPLTASIIQEKAREFSQKMNIGNFHPTLTWFEGLKKRFNLQIHSDHDGCSDMTGKLYTVWTKMLPYLVQGYEPENVFTCGETALFYKGLPDKCFIEGGVCLGTHHSTDFSEHRLTLLFSCSATGEKLKPLVIGKTSKPSSLLNLNTERLPVIWRSHEKACITPNLFADWLRELDRSMEQQNRHIALFMDMAPGHLSCLLLKNVSLKFYLDNSSSYLQPLQQGIITAFKAHYRKRFLQAVLARAESSDDSSQVLRNITELDAVYWIKNAWESVKTGLIINCFDAVGFSTVASIDDANDGLPGNLPELVEETGQALRFTPMYAEVYLQFDSQVPCHVQEPEDWEKQLLSEMIGRTIKTEPEDPDSYMNRNRLSVDSNSGLSGQSDSCGLVSQNEALDCLSKLKNFATNDSALLEKLYSTEESMLEAVSKKRQLAKFRNMNHVVLF